MAELFFSAHTLFLDSKEDLVRNLKKSAMVTTHNEVRIKLSSGLYTKILLPVSLGSSEEAELSANLCSSGFILSGQTGTTRSDPLQTCTWDSTFDQSGVANDLTFGIWLHTVKTAPTSQDNKNTSITLDA